MESLGRDITVKEATEKGDIAKSFQQLVETHFVSKRFKDIMGSTRLTRIEVLIFSLMEIQRIRAKIMSLSYRDTTDEVLKTLTLDEQVEVKELWALKKRFMINPHASLYALYDSFEYMYGLGLQSLDGLSREEGVQMVGGSFRKITEGDDLGRFERIKRRILGNVLYTE